jgi:hypothetical protein
MPNSNVTYNRLEASAFAAANSGNVEAMEWEFIPTITDAYLENTTEEELLALSILLAARLTLKNAIRLARVEAEIAKR